jgi:predicted O-linked N-acetylglucosamine transferase (SPINDLY family)
MGVPVVTLCGAHHIQRVSASILHAIGLDEFVTYDEESYLKTVCRLARDTKKRRTLMTGIRERMSTSVLCDEAAFGIKFGRLLMHMWKDKIGNCPP